jgi:hypothetical protein
VSAAWIGVIGVLGGVFLGAAVNIVADHFRWQREDVRLEQDRTRAMDDRRRELAVELATATDELFSRAWSYVDYRAENPKTWRTDNYAQALADQIESAVARVDRSYNELRILGIGDELAVASDALRGIAVDVLNATFADEVGEWDENELGAIGGRFLDAAHDEFGLTGGLRHAHRPAPALRRVPARPR